MTGRLWARIALVRIGFAIGRLLPVRRRVVLATSHADRLSGNLAFIREALRRQPDIPVAVLARRLTGGPWHLAVAVAFSVRAGYLLATSRLFIIDDYFFPVYVIKPRSSTTIVQTWHASGAVKKVGWSVLDKPFGASRELVASVPIHANYDVCLMGSKVGAGHYAEAFRQPIERFRTDIGIPRTDVFFGEQSVARIVANVRARYRLPPGRRVILYAPTFRGDTIAEAAAPEGLDLAVLASELASDHVLLVRFHPFVRRQRAIPPPLASFAMDASDHPDINELMLASDVLVTDYSTAIFDFALLGRPMVFFAPDHDEYEEARGLYFEYRSGVPGPVFETTEEVARYLRAGEFDLERVRRFREESWDVADGRASERFVELIVLPALA